jgi:hypothetical protein
MTGGKSKEHTNHCRAGNEELVGTGGSNQSWSLQLETQLFALRRKFCSTAGSREQ